MARPSATPEVERLRDLLAGLVTDGLGPYNIAENAGALLELEIVRARVTLPPDASQDERDAAEADALLAVVREAVERLRGRYRRLLSYVLPLNQEFVGKPIKERRTAAGKALKDGKTVKAGTIRTYYEPRALEDLARVLVDMDAGHRSGLESGSGSNSAA